MPSLIASDPYATHARFDCHPKRRRRGRPATRFAPSGKTRLSDASINPNDSVYLNLTLRAGYRAQSAGVPEWLTSAA